MERQGRRDTKPELALRRELWRRGLRYRVDVAPIGGPAATCRHRLQPAQGRRVRRRLLLAQLPRPRHRAEGESRVVGREARRRTSSADRDTDARLREAGWEVVRVWEHEDDVEAADRVEAVVRSRSELPDPRSPAADGADGSVGCVEGPAILAQTLTVPAMTRTPRRSRGSTTRGAAGTRHGVLGRAVRPPRELVAAAPARRGREGGLRARPQDARLRGEPREEPRPRDRPAARGRMDEQAPPRRFCELPDAFDMELTDCPAIDARPRFPTPSKGAVGAVHLALEAKACMTAFSKSYPRLYDELNSSHAVIHGASNRALAVGLAIINVADEFVSPVGKRNATTSRGTRSARSRRSSSCPGARATKGRIRRSRDRPRRPAQRWKPGDTRRSPRVPVNYEYERMIVRIANEYDVRFRNTYTGDPPLGLTPEEASSGSSPWRGRLR